MDNKIVKSNPYGMIKIEELENLESKLGTLLPEEYRNYLLEHNGGEFENTYFEYKEKFLFLNRDALFHIHEVYGVVDEPEWASLEDTYKTYNEDFYENGFNFKNDYLAIMGDDGGNQAVIKLKNPDKGSIYIWDHENPSKKIEKALTKVADTFISFIDAMLSEEDWLEVVKENDPEEYERLKRVVEKKFIEIYQYKNETLYFVPYSEVYKSYNMQPHEPVLSYKGQILNDIEHFMEAFKKAMSFSRSDLTRAEFNAICENNVFPLNEDKKYKSNTSVVEISNYDGANYAIYSTKLDQDGNYYCIGSGEDVPTGSSDTRIFEAFKKAMNKSIELDKE